MSIDMSIKSESRTIKDDRLLEFTKAKTDTCISSDDNEWSRNKFYSIIEEYRNNECVINYAEEIEDGKYRCLAHLVFDEVHLINESERCIIHYNISISTEFDY